MNGLNPELVAIIRSEMKGAWLKKFDESVEVLNISAAMGGWTPRGSVKAQSGFYQGCGISMPDTSSYMKTGKILNGPYGEYEEQVPNPYHEASFALLMCLKYGSAVGCSVDHIVAMLETMLHPKTSKLVRGKHSMPFISAWVALCNQKYELSQALTEARPLPVITKIGLSPKVTATLKEMNLDINLSSITMAEIKYREVLQKNKKGEDVLVKVPYVKWTPGTRFGRSRFHEGCQACGKRIPSNMYVPIEADDLKSGDHCGFWIGCDCARNIFGVQDIGIEKPVREAALPHLPNHKVLCVGI